MYSAISTARRDAYREYLKTASWRATRNRARRLAGWRCQRCGSGRPPLHVHHLTYDRLGHEWDQDLEVLCAGCHQGTHIQAGEQGPLRHYLMFARRAIEERGFLSYTDLNADVAAQCAARRIVCDGPRIAKALAIVVGEQRRPQPIVRRNRVVFTTPYVMPQTATAGAVLLLIRERLIRPWPGPPRQPAVHEQVVREQARDYYRAIYLAERKRRPIQERLAEIWR